MPHSHVDIGYTHPHAEVEAIQWRNLEQAIELARTTAIAERFGIDRCRPLVLVPTKRETPLMPSLPIKIEPASVLATSLRRSEDGQSWMLRLFSASPQTQKAMVKGCDQRTMQVYRSDPTLRPGIRLAGSVELLPWETVLLRCQPPSRCDLRHGE